MRVLLVNDFATGGGAEVVVADEMRLLTEAGHEVRLFTGQDAGGSPPPWRYVRNRRAARSLAGTVADFEPDVVHVHNYYHVLSPSILGAVAAPRSGRGDRPRLVMTAHDFHLVSPNSGRRCFEGPARTPRTVSPAELRDPSVIRRSRWDHRSRVHSWLKRRQHVVSYRGGADADLRRHLDLVFCPGAAAAAAIRSAGLPDEVPLAVLPNPFDRGLVRTSDADAGVSDELDPTGAIVFAGRIEPEKGLAELLDIWPRSSDGPSLMVIGGGSDLPRCRRTVQEHGLAGRVRFVGPRSRQQTLTMLGHADALVLASRWPEVAPMSILEAFALGVPVIGSDAEGIVEMIEATGFGAIFTPDEPASLAAAIERVAAPARRGDAETARVDTFLAAREPSVHLSGLLAGYEGSGSSPGPG